MHCDYNLRIKKKKKKHASSSFFYRCLFPSFTFCFTTMSQNFLIAIKYLNMSASNYTSSLTAK